MSSKSGNTDKDIELTKLKNVFERCGVIITERKSSTDEILIPEFRELKSFFFLGDFAAKNNEQDLALLAKVETNAEVSSGIRK